MALSEDLKTPPAPKKEVLGKIAHLLERNGIDVDEVGKVSRVNIWQGFYKDTEGEAHTVDMAGLSFSPAWEDGPDWDPVSQAPPVKCSVRPVKGLPKPEGWQTAVIVPDAQIGYYRGADGELIPTHDEDAISLCLSGIRDLNPEVVVCVGDMLDAPEFGKYRTSPAFALTSQASIDRCATFAAELRACAPNAEIVWLAGNHEERITNAASNVVTTLTGYLFLAYLFSAGSLILIFATFRGIQRAIIGLTKKSKSFTATVSNRMGQRLMRILRTRNVQSSTGTSTAGNGRNVHGMITTGLKLSWQRRRVASQRQTERSLRRAAGLISTGGRCQ